MCSTRGCHTTALRVARLDILNWSVQRQCHKMNMGNFLVMHNFVLRGREGEGHSPLLGQQRSPWEVDHPRRPIPRNPSLADQMKHECRGMVMGLVTQLALWGDGGAGSPVTSQRPWLIGVPWSKRGRPGGQQAA
jgi:hypothetical protein